MEGEDEVPVEGELLLEAAGVEDAEVGHEPVPPMPGGEEVAIMGLLRLCLMNPTKIPRQAMGATR